MTATASLALAVLVACGSPGESVTEEATRVPVMSDAAAQATEQAAAAATPETGPAASPAAATPELAAETPAATTTEPREAETVEIVSHDIFFEPAEVTIPADTDVTFILPNEGAAPHNFSIDALGISVDQAPGATEEVVINAPAGEYEFYCNVPGHKEAGMVGTLIVGGEAAQPTAPAEAAAPAVPATPAPATASTPAPAAATPVETAASPAAEQAAAASVEIVAKDIFFEPDEVTIPADTDVTVVLPNKGAALHNFSIDELGISVNIAPGVTEEVVINAPAGKYEYYCNIPGHKEAGMVGSLVVSGEASAAPPATPVASAAQAATPTAAEATAAAEEAAPAAAQGAAESVSVEVVSHDIFFEPDALSIPADADVAISLPNEGAAPHNFSIDELGISVDLPPGGAEEVVVNAPAGTYEYYCNVPGHKEAGMVGTLTVA